MIVFDSLTNFFKGRRMVANNIMLFALTGIFLILVNNIVATLASNIFYIQFIAVPLISKLSMAVNIFFSVLLGIYLFGYFVKYINQIFQDNDLTLPEFDLAPFRLFVKFLPIFLLWQLYYVLLISFLSLFVINKNLQMLSYISLSILLCSIPFVHLLYVKFISNFKFTRDVFYPWAIFKYLDKSILDIIFIFFQLTLISLIPIGLVFLIIKGVHFVNVEYIKLSIYLLIMCFGSYVLELILLSYFSGLANIIKMKFKK